jgi:GR25 family glycosyltransferase involved in LPS biosynthesis
LLAFSSIDFWSKRLLWYPSTIAILLEKCFVNYDFPRVICFLITTRGSAERQAFQTQQAAKFGLELNYVLDYDVEDLTDEVLNTVSPTLPQPSVSCLMKHVEAERRLLSSSADIAMIMEDDCILFSRFAAEFSDIIDDVSRLPPSWLVFLGGGDNKLSSVALASDKQKIIKGDLTTAELYLIDRASARERLRWIASNIITKPADHFLVDVDTQIGISHWRTSYPIATQGSITGQFVSQLDDSRRKHRLIYLRLRYWYNRFRRQSLPRFLNRFRFYLKKL